MAGSDDETTPPGWYRQKDDPGTLRWWDGEVWTDDLMPMPPGFGKAGRAAPDAPSAPAIPAPAIHIDERPERRPSIPLDPGPTRIRTSPPPAPRSPTPTRSDDRDAGSRVVRRGGRVTPGATVIARALLIAVVLGVGYVGYTKVRDAAPGDARTLSAAAPTVEKDGTGDTPLPKVVLSLSDLPRGWATQAFDAKSDDICQGLVPRNAIPPLELHSASFTQGSSGPFLTNVVSRFANADTAKAYMELTARTIDSCRSYESNGSTVRLSPLDFPTFGDETFVAKATGTYADGPLEGDIVYVRVGNRVASIETIAFGESRINKDLLEFLTRLVSRRM